MNFLPFSPCCPSPVRAFRASEGVADGVAFWGIVASRLPGIRKAKAG